jgi:Rab-like protein 2
MAESSKDPEPARDAIKIILLGDSAVGKSKLVERYLMDGYQPQQLSTYALTLFPHETEIDGRKVSVDFWDTAGQERFNSLHPSYYYQAHACILAFDITRKLTYKNLTAWYKELQEHRKSIPCLVVANKIDLDPSATSKSFNFATKRNLAFQYVSAAEGTNVVKVFEEAIRLGIACKEKPPDDFFDEVLEFLNEVPPSSLPPPHLPMCAGSLSLACSAHPPRAEEVFPGHRCGSPRPSSPPPRAPSRTPARPSRRRPRRWPRRAGRRRQRYAGPGRGGSGGR